MQTFLLGAPKFYRYAIRREDKIQPARGNFGAYFFLKHIEVVDDNPDEQIQREEGAANDEYHEINVGVDVGLALRL